MAKLLAACAALAGLSLLLPSEPSYDPMSWLVWGREIAHWKLDTSGGSSWKPLPVVFTLLFSPFSAVDDSIPPALWIALARAGALLALTLAFRLASRLAGGGVSGALGGLVAAAALVLLPDWFQFAAHGSEAPWAVALMLWAIERHLDGRRGQALVLGVLACLLRPELVPFLGLYMAWLWFAEGRTKARGHRPLAEGRTKARGHRPLAVPRLRALAVGLLALLVLAWVVPEWIGSGYPLDGGRQARSEPVWSLSLAERPWLRALERAHNHAGLALELLALAGLVGGLVRRRRAVLFLAGVVLAETGLYVAMTQLGFSGNPRYVLPALTLLCVLAGVGTASLLQMGAELAGRMFSRLGGAPARAERPALATGGSIAAVALGVLLVPFVDGRVERMRHEARQVGVRMDMHRDLGRAVDRIGGPRAVAALGTATANRAFHSRLAWELKVPISVVESLDAHQVVFRSWRELMAGKVFFTGRARVRRTLVRVGAWRVYRREGISFPLRANARRNSGRPPVYRPFAGN